MRASLVSLLLLLRLTSIEAADKVPPFTLKEPLTQKTVSSSEVKDAKAIVVVFLGTECPINNLFLPELGRLHESFSPKGVAFFGINSNAQDTPIEVAQHARKNDLPFPVLKDPGNEVADRFEAERTPEAFLLSPEGEVLYRGRIDDQFGIDYQRADKPRRRDLRIAIEEALAGKNVSVPRTKVAGCIIGRTLETKEDGEITFYRDVLPILQKRCQECHRPGQIGPMPLKEYKDVTAWSGMIEEVLNTERMPPWDADPKYGEFSNDRTLPEEERKILVNWIRKGMAEGDEKDKPEPRKFPEGWTIGKPDVIFKMPRKFEVPAEVPEGGVPYKYFVVPTGFKEDRWVSRAEARADATAVVHHMIIFIVPKGEWFNPDRPGAVLCGMAPGDMPVRLPEGYAKKVPAGARLVFQMHYTPNGKKHFDQSMAGLIFSKEKPKYQVLTRPILDVRFITKRLKIPAGADNHKMEAGFTFRRDGQLLAMMPHMHLRGKDFKYEAIFPDGKRKTLLSVPRYDFNWQSVYRLKEPLKLPKGTRIHCTAHFDNSEGNPNNPDPTVDVQWGDQTWQEMMIGWIDYCYEE